MREIPKTGLVRVSCGWWTDENDLDASRGSGRGLTGLLSGPCAAWGVSQRYWRPCSSRAVAPLAPRPVSRSSSASRRTCRRRSARLRSLPAASSAASAFRLTTLWTPGQTMIAADEATKLEPRRRRRGRSADRPRRLRGETARKRRRTQRRVTPTAPTSARVLDALSRDPRRRDLERAEQEPLLEPAGADGVRRAYEALLARCYDDPAPRLKVNVIGLALSSTGNDDDGLHLAGGVHPQLSATPTARAAGQSRILDTVAHHPYGLDAAERPVAQAHRGEDDRNGRLEQADVQPLPRFDGTGTADPGRGDVRLWYTESGVQTAVDAGKSAVHREPRTRSPSPTTPAGSRTRRRPRRRADAPDQCTQALDAIRLAACQPHVTAYFNFLLADEPVLAGWQSGALWVDRTRKDSWPAFQQAIAVATTGTVDCDALKGGRPSADFLPPNVPTGLNGAAVADPLRVDLSWSAPRTTSAPVATASTGTARTSARPRTRAGRT